MADGKEIEMLWWSRPPELGAGPEERNPPYSPFFKGGDSAGQAGTTIFDLCPFSSLKAKSHENGWLGAVSSGSLSVWEKARVRGIPAVFMLRCGAFGHGC